MLQRVRFISSIAALYILTLGTLGMITAASHLFGTPVWAAKQPVAAHPKPTVLPPKVISGKPIRIVIPSAAIDLPLDEGTYDPGTQSWTLSETHAQFATMSAQANDHSGTTFIYGHGTNAVFGKIGTTHPAAGSIAQIYTDNGHIFSYALADVHDFTPTDTSMLDNTSEGRPRLVVQTCTGVFSEWRTMFIFSLLKVEK